MAHDTPLFSSDLFYNVELAFDVEFKQHKNLNVFCPFHEDEETSTSRSCSVSREGMFHCKACGAKGDATSFYMRRTGLSREEARKDLEKLTKGRSDSNHTVLRAQGNGRTRTYAGSVCQIRPHVPAQSHKALREIRKDWLTYLHEERGLTDDVIDKYMLGADEWRLTIPIFDQDANLLNVRRYLPDRWNTSDAPKMVSHKLGNGSPFLYPYAVLDALEPGESTLIICEGEWDALLLCSQGFNAVTNTGNCSTWSPEWTNWLLFYHLVIIYDVNDTNVLRPELNDLGQRMAHERADEFLTAGALSVKVVSLPLTNRGGDITDWFMREKRTAEELQELIDSTPDYTGTDSPGGHSQGTSPPAEEEGTSTIMDDMEVPTQMVPPNPQAGLITLHEAALPSHYFKCHRMRCLVAGHGTAPYMVPKVVKAWLRDEEGVTKEQIRQFTAWDASLLSLLQVTQAQQTRILRQLFHVPKKSSFRFKIMETHTVEEVFLIPAIGDRTSKDQGPYTLRQCFYIGHGLKTNQVYDFLGFTLPHPRTQAVTHVLVKATPAQTDIDTFALSPSLITKLKKAFQGPPHEKFPEIARQMADHITHIYGRADLHAAIDLVFHSPLGFTFDGVRVPKGWLEGLVIGDTRTGKGYVATGLRDHYGVGEIISGENTTLPGLVGGVQHVGDKWTLVWGKLPLNDRRLVILDEASSLSHNEIGRLSRIRSEGIAEITKVISEKTSARTRLIWLANPRASGNGPRMMRDFTFGIEAAVDLIGAAEDMSRFDFVLTVAQNEVDPSLINKHHVPRTKKLRYTQELCRALVMWAWSRTPEQIVFDEGVVSLTLQAAQTLGKMFSPKVCLVQSEDARYKLARIAVATAARCFSTDDGEILIVRKEHIQYAYNFLHHIYNKKCCGYASLSLQERRAASLRSPAETWETLHNYGGDNVLDLVEGLLEHRNLTIRDLMDYSGADRFQSQSLMGDLVRQRALTKEHTSYIKRPAFTTFLGKVRGHLVADEPITPEELSND